MTSRPILSVGQFRTCCEISETLARLLGRAESDELEHPTFVLRWAVEEVERYHAAELAERRSRTIGDPNCPAGYR